MEGEEGKEGMWDGREYMQSKKKKLREQYSDLDQERASEIFAGVTIYVNGWTQPNADELKRLVHAHGGHYEYNLYGDSAVTHTIATNLPHAKINNLKGGWVCSPDWIVDSVAAGRRLPEHDYLLYTRHARGQKTLGFKAATANSVDERAHRNNMPAMGIEVSGESSLENLTLPQEEEVGVLDTEKVVQLTSSEANSPDKGDSVDQAVDSLEKLVPTAKPAGPARQYDAASGASFVSDYYTYSRLHHLSTWSTELKQFTSTTLPRVTQKYFKLPASHSLRGSGQRLVAHVDLDCFFVSVSLRDRPQLKGKPVAVCHAKLPKGRPKEQAKVLEVEEMEVNQTEFEESMVGSEKSTDVSGSASSLPQYLLKSMSDVASCSYEARSAGLRNGMSVGEALKRCPDLQLVPYEFENYHKVSKLFYEVLMLYSACIEPVSCDEAYIELTDYVRCVEDAEKVVREMRDEVKVVTGCTVSAGVAQNMLLARMATRVAKPNGQYFLSIVETREFLSTQRVGDLPGVGYSTAQKLREMGVETCSQLQELSSARLQSSFGSKTGQTLYNYCRGQDDRKLKLTTERKSISVDLNYGLRFRAQSDAEALISDLTQELQKRAREAQVVGGTLTLKLMIRKPDAPTDTRKYLGHGSCNNTSRSCHLLQPTADAAEMRRLAIRLLQQVRPRPEDIRGVGVQLTQLLPSSSSSSSSGGNQDLRCLLATAAAGQPNTSEKAQPLPAASNKPKPLAPAPQHLPPLPDLPGCSVKREQIQSTPSNLNDTFVIDLPPASQLDSSVLEALPPELTDKILRSYSSKEDREENGIGRGLAVPVSVGNVQKSPIIWLAEDNGVGRRGRGKGRGRGRGTGSPNRSPSKRGNKETATVSPKKQKRLFELLPESRASEAKELKQQCNGTSNEAIDPQLISRDHHTMTRESPVQIERDEPIEAQTTTSYELTTPPDPQDQFLAEFRAYLKEWVRESPKGPLDSDLESVTEFFIELCGSGSDSVFIVLRGFRRLVANTRDTDWCTAFNSLLGSVQDCISSIHNATLPIEPIR